MRVEHHAAGIILFRMREGKREYLLLKYARYKNYWGLCKGGVEPGESVLEAAIREMHEEVGFKNVQIHPLFKEKSSYFFFRDGTKVHKTVTYFCAQVFDENDGVLSEEHTGLKWYNFEDACKKITYPKDRAVVKKVEAFLQREEPLF